MLKRKLTKAEHAALQPLLQAEYKAEGEEFVLDASGFDDPGELRRALDRVRAEKTASDVKITELSTQLATITNVDARRAGDVATLEKSYKDQAAAKELEHKTALASKDKFIQETLVDSVALSMATELSGENAIVLLPHIKARLSAELAGEKPLTRVLDKDGKPSAMGIEDLKKEISTDKRFAAVVIASKASGGGAAGGGKPNGGGAPGGTKKFQELNDAERREWFQRDPKGFQDASKEANRPAYV